MPVLLFLPSPPVMDFYNGLVLTGSADDQTRGWIIFLTKLVFMSDAMFVNNGMDGVCHSYYTSKLWFDNFSCSIQFRLLDKIMDSFKYLGL